jgi:hypothetical protein
MGAGDERPEQEERPEDGECPEGERPGRGERPEDADAPLAFLAEIPEPEDPGPPPSLVFYAGWDE